MHLQVKIVNSVSRHTAPSSVSGSSTLSSHCHLNGQRITVSAGRSSSIKTRAYVLKHADIPEVLVDQVKYLVGSGPAADLRLTTPHVAAEHAELTQKAKQVFLKALQGETVFDRTYTWVDDVEARPNVSYVLASGSTLAFGDQDQKYQIEFDEPSGANPLVEMMMKGMAASAGADVQKELTQQ